MDDNQPTIRYRYAKRVGTAAGLGAVAVMAALSLAHTGSAPTSTTLAGSGDAPANTTYSQPVVAGMNMGATATWATPASTLATSMAVPPIKAGG
jgi:hypothetical protein